MPTNGGGLSSCRRALDDAERHFHTVAFTRRFAGKAAHTTFSGAGLVVLAKDKAHQQAAWQFIKFLTSLSSERQVLVDAALPPVWTQLYGNPALIRKFPYLPVLKKAILSAQPRPKIAGYTQFSLAISSAVHRALEQQVSVPQTLAGLSGELNQIVGNS